MGADQKSCLRSVVCNRQWPQHRLFKAGLLQVDRCRLCLDMEMPSGGQPGTLFHRWACPALAHVREKFMPGWLADYLQCQGDNPNASIVLALIRGLFFAPSIPHSDRNRFDTFTWFKYAGDILHGCVIFTDGSLLDGCLPKGCQPLG